MPRYRFTVTYETDDGSFDAWDEGFEVQSGSDTFGSWDAYTGVLNSGDEVQFINSTSRETDLRSISGFTDNSDIIAGSSYIGYATTRTIASGSTQIQFTMHPTDHSGPTKTKVYSVQVPYVQYTGGRNMNDIGNFLGDPNPKNIGNWYRGGTSAGVYVPNIPDGRNNSVPVWSGGSGPAISLNDFVGVWKNG